MTIQYKEISFIEFTELDCIVLFHDETTARHFGVITNGIINYKFSWQSDLIDPIVKVFENNVFCCLGIDQMFSILKFSNNAFRMVLKLDYLLYDVRFIGGGVWVITELELLVIDVIYYNVVKRISLPSFFQAIISESPLVTVECIEGEIVYVEIP